MFLDEMLLAGLAPDFAEKAIALAAKCQGMFELVEMWSEHRNEPRERELDLLSIYDLIRDNEKWETK